MEIKKIKLVLIELILKEEDETLLLALKDDLEKKVQSKSPNLSILEEPAEKLFTQTSNKIIGYDADGKALNLSDYNESIEKGIDDIKNNRFISQQDLEKEIENWANE